MKGNSFNTSGHISDAGRMGKTKSGPPIIVPLILILLFVLCVWGFSLDLNTAQLASDGHGGWPEAKLWIVQFLYRYGTLPSLVTAIAALLVWFASYFKQNLKAHRPLAMFMALVMIVGPGILVNGVFKAYFGRPRPREVVEFGGDKPFAPLGEPHLGLDAHSFPSGHASMGFYWLGLGVFFYERNRRLSFVFTSLGLLHGGLMGVARICQGGHWLSDIFASAAVVYLVAWGLYRLLKLSPLQTRAV